MAEIVGAAFGVMAGSSGTPGRALVELSKLLIERLPENEKEMVTLKDGSCRYQPLEARRLSFSEEDPLEEYIEQRKLFGMGFAEILVLIQRDPQNRVHIDNVFVLAGMLDMVCQGRLGLSGAPAAHAWNGGLKIASLEHKDDAASPMDQALNTMFQNHTRETAKQATESDCYVYYDVKLRTAAFEATVKSLVDKGILGKPERKKALIGKEPQEYPIQNPEAVKHLRDHILAVLTGQAQPSLFLRILVILVAECDKKSRSSDAGSRFLLDIPVGPTSTELKEVRKTLATVLEKGLETLSKKDK